MAARQIWLFLAQEDVVELFTRLEAREPGLVTSQGRYLRGDPQALLRDPATLERRESMPGEVRYYLLHRKHSADVVAHPQPAGPFKGWSQIDEERTDCLTLRVPSLQESQIGPSRLYASTSFWRGPTKIRKRPVFAIWANQTLRWLLGQYPSTAVNFMRVGPTALAEARRGSTRLSYLFRDIGPVPIDSAPAIAAPSGTVTGESADDEEGSP